MVDWVVDSAADLAVDWAVDSAADPVADSAVDSVADWDLEAGSLEDHPPHPPTPELQEVKDLQGDQCRPLRHGQYHPPTQSSLETRPTHNTPAAQAP